MTAAVAIRVDASQEIGTGHFMRCVALADALGNAGARVRFLSRHAFAHLQDLVRARGHAFRVWRGAAEAPDELAHSRWLGTSQRADASESAVKLSDVRWDWLVADHYAIDARWESALRGTARHVMAIDDIADRHHDCDLLLDQNLYLDAEERYAGKTPAGCRLLLGPGFALLREEFRRLHASAKPRDGRVRRVLVFFGGVDAAGETLAAVAVLAGRGLHVDVVVGAQNARRNEIEGACAAQGFSCHVQTAQMAELMAAADLAIGAGGSTSWERCCLGLPAIALALAGNQERLIEHAALSGLLYAPGTSAPLADHLEALLGNPLLLRALSRNGLAAVDGRGTQRVLRTMGCTAVAMRIATQADSARLHAWRNHPDIRSVSANSAPIDGTTHEAWLAATLADADRALLIGERNGEEVGVVRFDLHGTSAEVSIYLAPGHAGGGDGGDLLAAAEFWLAEERPEIRTLDAHVLRDNARSHGLFAAAGYRPSSTKYSKSLHR